MRWQWIGISAFIVVVGIVFEIIGLPVFPWIAARIASWFQAIPDIHDNLSDLVGSFAWPIAIVAIIFLFRRPISTILRSAKRLKWGDLSIELDKLERDAGAAEQGLIEVEPDDRFSKLLTISPAAAILDAWSPIERRVRELAKGSFASSGYRSVFQLIRMLEENDQIDSDTFQLIRELSKIRNLAAHSEDVSESDAYRFYTFANRVMAKLN